MTTVVMVVGHVDWRGRVADQLAPLAQHYGDVMFITVTGPGPSYQASGWAVSHGHYIAEVPNMRRVHGDDNERLCAAAMLALRPHLCVSFGRCPAAEAAKAAGVPTYVV